MKSQANFTSSIAGLDVIFSLYNKGFFLIADGYCCFSKNLILKKCEHLLFYFCVSGQQDLLYMYTLKVFNIFLNVFFQHEIVAALLWGCLRFHLFSNWHLEGYQVTELTLRSVFCQFRCSSHTEPLNRKISSSGYQTVFEDTRAGKHRNTGK